MEALLKEITYENIPKCLGGGFELYNEKYDFDLSPSSGLWYEGCPPEPVKSGSKKAESSAAANGVANKSSSNSPNGHVKSGKDFAALHKTGVHFPSNLTSIPEGSERPSDVSSRKNNSSSSESGSGKGGVLVSSKRGVSEVLNAVRGAPVFSFILFCLLFQLSLIHWNLVTHIVPSTLVLFLLLSLLFGVPEEA